MCAVALDIQEGNARHQEEERTYPRQETQEEREENLVKAKVAKVREKINGDRQTSVVEKGEKGFQHSTIGRDKTQVMIHNGRY